MTENHNLTDKKKKVGTTPEERAEFINSVLRSIEDDSEEDTSGAEACQERRRQREERKEQQASRNEDAAKMPEKPVKPAEAVKSERPGKTEKTKKQENPEKPEKQKEKKSGIFWIGLAIYAALLLVGAFFFLRYTDRCLIKYENSQSEHAMDNIVSLFQKSAESGKLKDQITLDAEINGVFEDLSVYKELYLKSFRGAKNYTFRRSENSYLTEAPVYDILADEKHVARITLRATNERTIFGILTIVDWEVEKVEPVLTVGTNDYTITVDQTYEVYLNGIKVTEEYQKGEVVSNPEYVNVVEYVQMPATVTYKVKGLVNTPKLVVKNEKGEEEELSFDENHTASKVITPTVQQMPGELADMAWEAATQWEHFVTRDLPGEKHGLATIQKYLIKDSYYWEMAKKYATSEDITFISDHTVMSPAFTEQVIDQYIPYGENCFSVHISFVKNMKLIKNGQVIRDKIDAVFYFVRYDDTDDGQENPHWAIVDMIPVTNH